MYYVAKKSKANTNKIPKQSTAMSPLALRGTKRLDQPYMASVYDRPKAKCDEVEGRREVELEAGDRVARCTCNDRCALRVPHHDDHASNTYFGVPLAQIFLNILTHSHWTMDKVCNALAALGHTQSSSVAKPLYLPSALGYSSFELHILSAHEACKTAA